MSNAFKIAPSLCLALAFFSCSLLSFEELKTEISVPENQSYYAAEWVQIDFSILMDRASVENLLSLKEDGKIQETRALWLGNSCLVSAQGAFKKGRKYILSAQGAVYAADGRTYTLNIFREFIFGTEDSRFELVSNAQMKDSDGDLEFLELKFNKAVNPATFERNFTLSPNIDVNKEYSSDWTSVKIFPKTKWKANTFYSWQIDGVCSKDGAKLFKSYSGTFLAVQKEKEPQLTRACPVIGKTFFEDKSLDDLLERQSIGLIFDREMNFESIKKGVYFSPATQVFWEEIDARRFVFTPSANYQIGRQYRLTISDAVEDKWGINFKGEKNIFFTQKTSFIEIEKITLNAAEIQEKLENKVKIEDEGQIYFRIFFSRFLDDRGLLEIKSAVKFEGSFPDSLKSPRLSSIAIISKNCVEFSYTSISAADVGQDCVYKLTIRGGEKFIYDSQGEYLKEDKCFYINFLKKN